MNGMGSRVAPGGRNLHSLESIDKSSGLGRFKMFGAETDPSIHWSDVFTWLPISSPTDTPVFTFGINAMTAVTR